MLEELILHNVFCVHVFHYNLISVSELVRGSKCSLLLHSDKCFIEDHPHGKMIGLAKLEGGIYHLMELVSFVSSCKTKNVIINACDVWHSRLGHASYFKIELLHKLDSNVNVQKKVVCDSCHFGKTEKSSFSQISLIFQLLVLTWCTWTFGGHINTHTHTLYIATNIFFNHS